MSSGADRKRAAMDSWMSRHPSSVSFDDKDEIAYCEAPSSVLGKDAGGDIVVEGLHASRTAAVPVAVKLLPGLSSPPSPPYLIVHRTVPDHPNVIPPPLLRRYRGGYLSASLFAEACLDEVCDWCPNGLPEASVKEILFDILSGLAVCHSVGVVHTNIRPENIALIVTSHRDDASGPTHSRAAITGFRKSMLVPPSDPFVSLPGRCEPGALEFCSSEARVGGRLSLTASDVCSVGLLGWHLLTGGHLCAPHTLPPEPLAMSSECRSLLSALSAAVPADRPTALAALSHEWFKDSTGQALLASPPPDATSLQALRRGRRKLFEQLTTPPAWPFTCSLRSKDVLGRGFHGTVYRGVYSLGGQPCAVKCMPRGGDRTRECRALRCMPPHPNVVPAPFASRSTHGFAAVFTFPLADGFLEPVVDKLPGKRLPPDAARTVFVQLVTGLAHCHTHGVAHLDIKPDNVMFLSGVAVLTDFGNAQLFDATVPPMRATTRFANQPRARPYAAPELFRGEGGTYSVPLTDIWSIGALLHFMLTGEPITRTSDGSAKASSVLDAGTTVFLNQLCSRRQDERPLASAILEHEWCKGPTLSADALYTALGLSPSGKGSGAATGPSESTAAASSTKKRSREDGDSLQGKP